MIRQVISPRADKNQKLLEIGLSFHDWDNYWREDSCYKFSAEQINILEEATIELHQMCKHAVKHVIDNNLFEKLAIPQTFWEPIKQSFAAMDFSLYGRFDLAYDGINPPKMLEYNADTPTSLLESAVAQWHWMEDTHPGTDQFNSLHDRLIHQWRVLTKPSNAKTIHFTSISDNEEDFICIHYLMDTAVQAGFSVKHSFIEGLGFDHDNNIFIDSDDEPIHYLFKLYPWEWLQREEFGEFIADSRTQFIEPIWKSVLANKGLLAILWELYPYHPNLVPAYLDGPRELTSFAKKPLFSREGANVELYKNNKLFCSDDGEYGTEGHVYQQLIEMPCFDDKYPVIGSWVVGQDAAGMCLREDDKMITTNMSNFVCHYFE